MRKRTWGIAPEVLLDRARTMRRAPTRAEHRLWHSLRAGRAAGVAFRRQAPILGFISDFLAASARLVVEVDGASHDHEVASAEDDRREKQLKAAGFEVLRVTEDDVLRDSDEVASRIIGRAVERRLALR